LSIILGWYRVSTPLSAMLVGAFIFEGDV